MQRITIMLLMLTLSASISVSAPALKDLKRERDSTRILGHWKLESLSLHGGQPDDGQGTTFRFSKDGSCGITNGSTENGAKYTLDASTTPARMKWLNGPQLTEWLCLYELEGDNLKIAFVDPNTEAPKKIEPTKNLTIYYLTRHKN